MQFIHSRYTVCRGEKKEKKICKRSLLPGGFVVEKNKNVGFFLMRPNVKEPRGRHSTSQGSCNITGVKEETTQREEMLIEKEELKQVGKCNIRAIFISMSFTQS